MCFTSPSSVIWLPRESARDPRDATRETRFTTYVAPLAFQSLYPPVPSAADELGLGRLCHAGALCDVRCDSNSISRV